mmetsp:Transcript_24620/g.77358  ORF Transcript_24620/g.77358 Transcript_24620/m.77358 type:complete len:329 (-) Transcript_24620:17-1003(-)
MAAGSAVERRVARNSAQQTSSIASPTRLKTAHISIAASAAAAGGAPLSGAPLSGWVTRPCGHVITRIATPNQTAACATVPSAKSASSTPDRRNASASRGVGAQTSSSGASAAAAGSSSRREERQLSRLSGELDLREDGHDPRREARPPTAEVSYTDSAPSTEPELCWLGSEVIDSSASHALARARALIRITSLHSGRPVHSGDGERTDHGLERPERGSAVGESTWIKIAPGTAPAGAGCARKGPVAAPSAGASSFAERGMGSGDNPPAGTASGLATSGLPRPGLGLLLSPNQTLRVLLSSPNSSADTPGLLDPEWGGLSECRSATGSG